MMSFCAEPVSLKTCTKLKTSFDKYQVNFFDTYWVKLFRQISGKLFRHILGKTFFSDKYQVSIRVLNNKQNCTRSDLFSGKSGFVFSSALISHIPTFFLDSTTTVHSPKLLISQNVCCQTFQIFKPYVFCICLLTYTNENPNTNKLSWAINYSDPGLWV